MWSLWWKFAKTTNRLITLNNLYTIHILLCCGYYFYHYTCTIYVYPYSYTCNNNLFFERHTHIYYQTNIRMRGFKNGPGVVYEFLNVIWLKPVKTGQPISNIISIFNNSCVPIICALNLISFSIIIFILSEKMCI